MKDADRNTQDTDGPEKLHIRKPNKRFTRGMDESCP